MNTKKIADEISKYIYESYHDREEMAIQLERVIHVVNLQALEGLSTMLKTKIVSEMNWPNDFDGAHHIAQSRKYLPYDAMGDYSNIEPSKEQARLDNFNKNNPTNNLQDLM